VADYTSALQDAFCVFEVLRYHPNLKVQARDARKVYIIDPGLRTVGARSVHDDTGKLLENLVRRQGCEVSYYQGRFEVDFIITDHYSLEQRYRSVRPRLMSQRRIAERSLRLLECWVP